MSVKASHLCLSRPNFFPGQLIDYQDFNRLAEQADKMLALLFGHLYSGGGILVDTLEGFQILPLQGFQVRIKPGIGLLPSGYPVVLQEERILDLTPFLVSKSSQWLLVSIHNMVRGKDRYCDQEDTSITGYRSEVFEPEFTVSEGQLPPGALELFRVYVTDAAKGVELASAGVEWQEGKLKLNEKNALAPIDFRFRRSIVPQTYLPMPAEKLTDLRRALYQLEEQHRKITKLYLVEDGYGTVQYLTQLHAELLQRPLQPLKVGFLLSEFSEKLSLFLESLLNRVGHQKTHFDRGTLLESIALLDQAKQKEVLPRNLPLELLPRLVELLRRFLNYAEEKFSLMDVIEEAMLDLTHRGVEFAEKMILGGHLFERVDVATVEDKEMASPSGRSAKPQNCNSV